MQLTFRHTLVSPLLITAQCLLLWMAVPHVHAHTCIDAAVSAVPGTSHAAGHSSAVCTACVVRGISSTEPVPASPVLVTRHEIGICIPVEQTATADAYARPLLPRGPPRV